MVRHFHVLHFQSPQIMKDLHRTYQVLPGFLTHEAAERDDWSDAGEVKEDNWRQTLWV